MLRKPRWKKNLLSPKSGPIKRSFLHNWSSAAKLSLEIANSLPTGWISFNWCQVCVKPVSRLRFKTKEPWIQRRLLQRNRRNVNQPWNIVRYFAFDFNENWNWIKSSLHFGCQKRCECTFFHRCWTSIGVSTLDNRRRSFAILEPHKVHLHEGEKSEIEGCKATERLWTYRWMAKLLRGIKKTCERITCTRA